jgi:hypothetical protein
MSRKLAGWLAAFVACAAPLPAGASEGAASYYFPGAFGSFLVAVPPEPGFSGASQTLIFGGNAQKSILNGRQTFGINAFAVYEYLAGLYVFEQPILGGRLQVGVAVPAVTYATMTASLQTRLFGTFSGTSSDVNFGDLMLTPFSFTWNFGELSAKLTQIVIAPTGHYDVNAVINVGRNYWAFDTQVGLTWLHKATGTELSVLPGILINTMNPATAYRTGTEFHLDFMANQFVTTDIAIGLHGYWYRQIDGDSGQGATFGPFMGESFGMGPAVLWAPAQLEGRYAFIAKWLHDFSNTNRLNGDWGSLSMSWRF